jgi:hypothetical protein
MRSLPITAAVEIAFARLDLAFSYSLAGHHTLPTV